MGFLMGQQAVVRYRGFILAATKQPDLARSP